jgi:type I restriction enzyme, R subunit
MNYNENILELTALERLAWLGYEIKSWPELESQRWWYDNVILSDFFRSSLQQVNPTASQDSIDEVVKKIERLSWTQLLSINQQFHKYLTDGVDVQIKKEDGTVGTQKIKLIDQTIIKNNHFLAVNQLTITKWNHQRRTDIILYINGLPLVVIELKNLVDENTTIQNAYNQIQTYKSQIEQLFYTNAFCIISDGLEAKMWTLTSSIDRYMSWKTPDGKKEWSMVRQLENMVYGALKPSILIDLILNYTIFQTDGEKITKILWAYHQYFAVQKAVDSTIGAVQQKTKKAWVVRHTQWSGKSLTMVFYAGQIIQKLNNPTLVVITDRNDLDDQLFGTFSLSKDLLRQTPQQAKDAGDLKKLLAVASGGVIFTTVQKFSTDDDQGQYPLLTDRSNVVIIADEAHRTQYGLKAKVDKDDGQISYGFAKYLRDALPNASFIGFTGTPIEFTDKNTKATFGDYIDVYDIAQAVQDWATVPIYYEARLAKINLIESERPTLDADFEEVTESEEMGKKEKLKSRRARLEAMVGTEKRLQLIAQDIVNHFENRCAVQDGKGMIVSMSRRICVELYAQIIKLRPEWHSDDDTKGVIKVVMTWSASDPENFQPHVRTKQARDDLAKRMKNINDPLKLVIVRDMWLTGFDVPSMHTMYIDKPMQGHWLMQAIARVNRVYKDKQAGLIVDYLGIATQLKEALSYYTQGGDKKDATIPQEQAISVMHEKYEVVQNLYHGFDYKKYFTVTPTQRSDVIASAMEHVLTLDDGVKRYVKAVTELSHAFSIAIPADEALAIRDDVAFFMAIKACFVKLDDSTERSDGKTRGDYDHAIKQLISGAVTSDEVLDVFKVAWIDKPDLSILSDEFLEEVKGMKHKNLAFELLRKLLNNKIRSMQKKNLVMSRSFAEMLEMTIRKYQNRTLESAEIIAELIELAKKIQTDQQKWIELGLTDEEIAFYDALAKNESAVKEMGDETLREMARELVKLVRENTSIDRTIKEDVQAKLLFYIKRLLKKYKYPPDLQERATETILRQAKLTAEEVANDL